jgi:hypothetical protein
MGPVTCDWVSQRHDARVKLWRTGNVQGVGKNNLLNPRVGAWPILQEHRPVLGLTHEPRNFSSRVGH